MNWRVKDFTAVIENNPKINYNSAEALWALNLRAECRRIRGMLDEALADLNVACKYEKDNYGNFADRAFIHKELGHYKMALRDINKAIKLAQGETFLCLFYESRATILLEGFKDKKKATKDFLIAQTLRNQ